MIDRMALGHLPAKPHTAFRDEAGNLLYEECLTRQGFAGAFTIAYHLRRPHQAAVTAPAPAPVLVEEAPPQPLARRHYDLNQLRTFSSLAPQAARTPLLFNDDLTLWLVQQTQADDVYQVNGDADLLCFIWQGSGRLRTPLGELAFQAHDYLVVPRGLAHRFLPDAAGAQWIVVESRGRGLGLPSAYRNELGQLRMDAPYSHRDFRRPTTVAPIDDPVRELLVKRDGRHHGFVSPVAICDVVGWDGTVYPFAFAIRNFAPRVGAFHLPPTVHATFVLEGAVVCSFVPRPLDFGAGALPCPYPHSSVDCDEIIFYAGGTFTSHPGLGVGSLTHHPAGVPHGPHPGAYEGSEGTTFTDELAVMIDTFRPLRPSTAIVGVEDRAYHASF